MRNVIILVATFGLTCMTLTPRVAAFQSDTRPPAPAVAPKKVDRTNVKAVVQAYAAALASGDKATAKSLVAGSAKQIDYVDAMVDEYQAIIRFDKALKAKFRADANEYLDYYEKYGELAKKAEIEMEGDDKASATFEIEEKAAEEYWDLVKRNGQWSIDAKSIWDPEEETETSPAALRKSAKEIDALTKRIIAGQFSSAEDAVDAYDNR